MSLMNMPAYAFDVPERLEYDLSWIGINAGRAVLSIENRANTFVIESRAESNRFISSFYKVDDRITCVVDRHNDEFGYALNYRVRIREGRHRRDKEVTFDHNAQKAFYVDHRKNEKKEYKIEGNSYDPLSAFYSVRRKDLQQGETVTVKVFDSKKMWNVPVEILRKEKVRVPAGAFDTIVIKPDLTSEGIFQRKGDIFIWLTDDEKKVPVKVTLEVLIGHVAAELTGGNY